MNRISKVVEGHGTIWVVRRMESEYLIEVSDHLLEVLQVTRLVITSMSGINKVVEGRRTIWVARRKESECFAVVCEVCHPYSK
jgi:hypothetical protein